MKLTFVLKNTGTAQQTDVILNATYFVFKDSVEEIELQEFNIRLSNADPQKKRD